MTIPSIALRWASVKGAASSARAPTAAPSARPPARAKTETERKSFIDTSKCMSGTTSRPGPATRRSHRPRRRNYGTAHPPRRPESDPDGSPLKGLAPFLLPGCGDFAATAPSGRATESRSILAIC
ncbi:protein of unknown function [Methylorubrum extorquens]|uniref:Uncharacterized protein n=1 Tax=Methylorubrum extorquens TaxID=408 RepID=A0A2N9AMA5_METEX|nr:protein of unknown function [Methylorubrum extorquens]